MSKFQKATKKQAKLRMALIGPSNSGKTYTALRVATNLVPGGKVAFIDTERGSASKYADKFDFDVLELESFDPEKYVEAIRDAENAGYDVIIVDSLSHAWMGKGGALEQVDNAAARQKGNSYTAWRDVTPKHNKLVEAMVASRAHIIGCMRAKTEYVLEEDDRGRKVPRKIGMAPIQRDGMEYEFDVVGDMDHDNRFIVTKTRCSDLHGKVFVKPGEELAEILTKWLTDGAEAPVKQASAPAQDPAWFTEIIGLLTSAENEGDIKTAQDKARAHQAELVGGLRQRMMEAGALAKKRIGAQAAQ